MGIMVYSIIMGNAGFCPSAVVVVVVVGSLLASSSRNKQL